MRLNLSNRSIKECLEIAAEKEENVLTNSCQRMIGKTTALIEFARERNYFVVVNDEAIANGLRFKFQYEYIVGIDKIHALNKKHGYGTEIVFDECCNPKRIDQLINGRFVVITGFINDKHSECVTSKKSEWNGYARSSPDVIEQSEPLLTITLSDIDAVPIVQYKGKPIDNKIRVSVDWVTNTDTHTDKTYIHIEHVEPDEVRGNTKVIQHNHPIDKETLHWI